jgi:predicted nucleotidyltransferase
MVYHSIELPMERIAEICRRNHIRRLALFGSILTDDFRPDSDVDRLVEFEPDKTPGLESFGIEIELSDLDPAVLRAAIEEPSQPGPAG